MITLFDKDVTSPIKELETTQCSFTKNSKTVHNSKKSVEESKVKPASSSVIIGDHEVKAIKELLRLEKKPLECYFEGLKGKPVRKKKIRQPKKGCLNFWDFKSSPVAQNEGWISTLSGAPAKESEPRVKEDILKDGRMQAKIKNYERIKEHKQQKITMKQRLAEEKYLEQQENLAETWLGVLRRRSQLRNMTSEDWGACPQPAFRRTPSSKGYNRIDISLLSKKFWSDGDEKEPFAKKAEREEKKSAVPQKKAIRDDIEEHFAKKLVFIDSEDCDALV